MTRRTLAVLLLGLAVAPAAGETIVVGGGPGSLAWAEHHAELSVIDFDTNPGFILPEQNGPEDNISLKLLERGGKITSPNARVVLEVSQSDLDKLLKNMVDGRNNAFEMDVTNAQGIIFRVDLGERFGVNRIRFFPREGFEERYIRGYQLALNDGSEEQRTLSGSPDLRVYKMEERVLDPVIDIPIPLQFVRYVEIKQLVRGPWEIDEFEVFGEGFASSAAYVSEVFDQGQPAVFGDLIWGKATIGEPTKVTALVSTRNGTTPDPSDSLSWSVWSPPYPAGVPSSIVATSPRRYWQFQVQLRSTDILSAMMVDSVAVEVSPALADSLVAEVWPQEALIGQDTELTYWVRSYNSRGFDRLDIETQAPVEVIKSVQVDGSDVTGWERTDIDGGVRISFPTITGDRVLSVVFESIALRFNTVFAGRVSNSRRPQNLPQALTEGNVDADPLASGNDLTVAIRVGDRLLGNVEASPSPFTPNGDGVNDETAIFYDVINLTSGAPVSVVIYDLTGQRRKVVYSGMDSSGRFRRAWDGTDDGGQKLPPGVYVVHVEIAADTGTERKTAIVPVAY